MEQQRRQQVVILNINIRKKGKIMKYCQNCGHDCHCGNKCEQELVNEFGEKYKIECCGYCRHEKKKDFDPDEVKYDASDYDSFNGA